MAAPSAPKTEVEVPPVDIAAAILELAKSIKSGQQDTGAIQGQLASLERFLVMEAESRPHENLNPPMKSYANPEGERDHPRAELHCKTVWVGYRLNKEGLTRTEIELLNRVEPGNYRVTKSDGKSIPFDVSVKVDDAGKRERKMFYFPCKNSEDRSNHLSMESYLREVLGESASTESLRAQIEVLRQQLQGVAKE